MDLRLGVIDERLLKGVRPLSTTRTGDILSTMRGNLFASPFLQYYTVEETVARTVEPDITEPVISSSRRNSIGSGTLSINKASNRCFATLLTRVR